MLKPETAFDERWMRSVHDRVAWPALEAVEDLSLSRRTRIMRIVNSLRREIGLPSRGQRAMDETVRASDELYVNDARRQQLDRDS